MINRSEIPTSVNLGKNNSVTYGEINRRLSSTEHGQKLARKTRYKIYNLLEIPSEKWVKDLGVDTNNLKHMPLTYGLGRVFIKYSKEGEYSLADQENLLLACGTHDIAEAITEDITFNAKTKIDEEIEIGLLHQMTTDIFSDVPGLKDRLSIVIETIIKDSNSRLGKPFNAIERLGYLRTGLRAFEISPTKKGKQKTGLKWLTTDVLLNQIPPLIEYSKIYPPVSLYLESQKDSISKAFETLPKSVFKYYPKEDRIKRKQMYQSAKETWQNFVS